MYVCTPYRGRKKEIKKKPLPTKIISTVWRWCFGCTLTYIVLAVWGTGPPGSHNKRPRLALALFSAARLPPSTKTLPPFVEAEGPKPGGCNPRYECYLPCPWTSREVDRL